MPDRDVQTIPPTTAGHTNDGQAFGGRIAGLNPPEADKYLDLRPLGYASLD